MYRVEVAEGVLKRLKRLPSKHQRQVLERIEALADHPRPQDCKKLKGMDGYRITIGEYRGLYVDDEALRLCGYASCSSGMKGILGEPGANWATYVRVDGFTELR